MKRLLLIVLLLVCCLASVGQSIGQQPTLTYPFPGMEWSPDGSSIAFTSREGAWLYSDGNIHEITLGAIDDITWSSSGDLVALLRRSRSQAMFTGEIEIWDVSSFVSPILVRSFTDDGMKGEDVENLDWNPISNLIAVSGIGIRIWNADNGALVTATESTALSLEVQWSPDGFEVASFAYTLTIWDSLTGELQQEIELPLSIYWGSWGNDSQYIAIVQSSGGVPYYGIDIYKLGLTKPNLSPIILAYDYPLAKTEWKGNTLVSLTSGGIQLWDVPTHQPIRKISLAGRYNFALSPDGSQIAYIQDGVLQIQAVNTPFVAPTPTATPD